MKPEDDVPMSEKELDEVLHRADDTAVSALALACDTEHGLARVVEEAERRSPKRPAPTSGDFWRALHDTERTALQEVAQVRTFSPGATVWYQDDPSKHVLVIQTGWVKVSVSTQDGHEVVLAIRGPGDIAGEESTWYDRPRSATVTTLGSVRALVIPADRFAAFLDQHPQAARVLTSTMVRRIDDADRRVRAHSSDDGAKRLATLLLDLAEQHGTRTVDGAITVSLPLSQQDLASWVGASRETIARALRRWRDRDLVRTGRRKITIVDAAALQAFTHGRRVSTDLRQVIIARKVTQPDAKRASSGTGWPVAPTRTSAQRGPGLSQSQHCVLFAVDIAGFTDRRRDDEVQLAMRAALYRLLTNAFEAAGVPWRACVHEDRGDGALVVIPATVLPTTIIDPLFNRLRDGLRRHNRLASEAAQIRLRVAVHIGEVYHDEHGLVGRAVNHLFWLLEAPVLKHVLDSAGAELALIASEYIYDTVIRDSEEPSDPTTYDPVTVNAKAAHVRGWVHAPPERTSIPMTQRRHAVLA